MNTWRMFSALLALCLLSAPALRAEPPTITDVRNDIAAMKAELKNELAALRVTAQKNQDDLELLRKRLEALEQRLDTLAKEQRRIALYPPQGAGTIRLVNR